MNNIKFCLIIRCWLFTIFIALGPNLSHSRIFLPIPWLNNSFVLLSTCNPDRSFIALGFTAGFPGFQWIIIYHSYNILFDWTQIWLTLDPKHLKCCQANELNILFQSMPIAFAVFGRFSNNLWVSFMSHSSKGCTHFHYIRLTFFWSWPPGVDGVNVNIAICLPSTKDCFNFFVFAHLKLIFELIDWILTLGI